MIGVNDGGLKESIIDGKTGILLPKNISKNDIKNGVLKMTTEFAKNMENDAIKRSKYFSLENFSENLKKFL